MPKTESFASSLDEPIDRLKKNLTNRLTIQSNSWEKLSKFEQYSLKNKESNKKMVRDFEFEWERYDWNKPKCSVFEHAHMNSNWVEVLGRPHFLSLARCEELGNWPWWHSKMNYTLALHWIADELTQGSKTDQTQKRDHSGAIRKKLGACDTPKINASVDGQNWGSTTC